MTRGRSMLLTVAGVVLAFAAGAGWQYLRAERLEQQLERTRQELGYHELAATLGAATIEAQEGRFEPARRLASRFYTELQRHANEGAVPTTAQPEVRAILAQRDQVITVLSRGDPQAPDMLAHLFGRFRTAWAGEPAMERDTTSAGEEEAAS